MKNSRSAAMVAEPYLNIVLKKDLPTFSQFVYNVYASRNAGALGWVPHDNEMRAFLQEDEQHFAFSLYLAVTNSAHQIIGTLKITRYHESLQFCIQKQFDIDIHVLAERYQSETRYLYHLGRLAVNKDILAPEGPGSRELFTRMLYRCLCYATSLNKAHVFAEASEAAVNLFSNIGLPMDIVGEADLHTGTHTYPVVIPFAVIRSWLANHCHLM